MAQLLNTCRRALSTCTSGSPIRRRAAAWGFETCQAAPMDIDQMGFGGCQADMNSLDMFDFHTQSKSDRLSAYEHDVGSVTPNFAALNRMRGRSMSVSDDEPEALDYITKVVKGDRDRITRQQISEFFAKHFNALLPHELDDIMDLADKDGSGDLTAEEFQLLCRKLIRQNRY
eukprot:gnl/MRDRNA2_/MRDRNA2_55808_c0_seq1.p1 gnl/MRDRNA2_/MRDRNA2_55808_c0~~gnl/MRDRNA2_/MRDRNA2_55808_c0_seq1.p1  ORF type:complete len:191 (+),score=30.21 gnl/MRDRNA2_/MRDRNA2_55808_c0_seq1:55-573(+)